MENSSILLRPVHGSLIGLFIVVVALGLWLNVTKNHTVYGSGNGKFADQVDSFSEYIIRNTVLNRLKGVENTEGSLIITKGYPDLDYTYYPDGTRQYYSHRGIQVDVYTAIGFLNRKAFTENSDEYFQAFRFINCLLLSVCVAVFFVWLFGKNLLSVLALTAFSFAGGIALFASNLYFMAWTLLTPLLCFPLLVSGHKKAYVISALFFSALYFSVRYEFATTFALMWVLPILILPLKTGRIDTKTGLLSFAAVCLGFILALLAHHFSIALEKQISIADAAGLIFENTAMRMVTLEDVPPPFSPEFFKSMVLRWVWNGFTVPLFFYAPKIAVLLVFLILLLRTKDMTFRRLFLWALIAYLSWYVVAYQHIVFHEMYDSLLFAATIQLVFLVYATNYFKNLLMKSSPETTP